jgi:hypothetical protein
MNRAIEYKLLEKEGDLLRPTFSLNEISIPLGFKPPRNLFERLKEEDLLSSIEATDEIEAIAAEKDVFREVAALMYAYKRGVDISKYIDKTLSSIKSRSSEAT